MFSHPLRVLSLVLPPPEDPDGDAAAGRARPGVAPAHPEDQMSCDLPAHLGGQTTAERGHRQESAVKGSSFTNACIFNALTVLIKKIELSEVTDRYDAVFKVIQTKAGEESAHGRVTCGTVESMMKKRNTIYTSLEESLTE